MDERALLDTIQERIRVVEHKNTNVLLETEKFRLVSRRDRKGYETYFLYSREKDTFDNDFWKPIKEVDPVMQDFLAEFIKGVDHAGTVN